MKRKAFTVRLPIIVGSVVYLATSLHAQAGLQLGGTFVPQDHIWVYLCLGNSAMSGRDPHRDTVPHPHAWNYRIPNYDRDRDRDQPPDRWQWIPARSPIHIDVRSSGNGGPVMPFVKKMAERFPDYYFGVMQHSGSAHIMSWYKYGEDRYTWVMDSVTHYLDKVTFGAFISMFGLVEVQYGGETKEDWLNIIETTVSDVRTDLEIPDLPYVHSGYPMEAEGNYDPTLTKVEGILAAEPEIPDRISNSVIIPTDSLSIYQDSFTSHYDSTGNAGWAQRVVDSLVAHGWVPGETGIQGWGSGRVSAIKGADRMQALFIGSDRWIPASDMQTGTAELFLPNGRKAGEISVRALRQGHEGSMRLAPGVYLVNTKGRSVN